MGKQFFQAGEFILENGEKRYELLEPVSFNSKFYIAHAKDIKLDTECLLKYVDCNDASYEVNNLLREGSFQFFHPYIEAVYGNFTGVDPNGDAVYGVSVEYIDGSDLYLFREDLEFKLGAGEIDEEEMETLIFRQMLEFLYGMKYYSEFSRKQYLHRDIKPQNVMITKEGHVKIIDFDFAHISGSNKTQNAIGWDLPFSTGYSSPEIFSFSGIRKMPDIGTEIYSAGRLFFFWLNGVEYYTKDQLDLKKDVGKGVGIPASALYCINEDISYGIQSNIHRFKKRYLGSKYSKLVDILDCMCAAPDNSKRYTSVDEILNDMYVFLRELYGGSYQEVSQKLGLDKLQILSKRNLLGEENSIMVAYKIDNGAYRGKPLFEYSMRDIMVDGEIVATVYNLEQKIYYQPFAEGVEIINTEITEEEDYRIYNKCIMKYKDKKIQFIIQS